MQQVIFSKIFPTQAGFHACLEEDKVFFYIISLTALTRPLNESPQYPLGIQEIRQPATLFLIQLLPCFPTTTFKK